MSLWSWVWQAERELRANGHDRLADLLDKLPSLVVDRRHAEVDALIPEALALASTTELPWLEIFFRHWELQSLVLGRCNAKQGLPKAVKLIELSSRPGNRECPQSVCAVQDLANCYGLADGPGYVEERLQVAAETLAKIGPDLGCYVCISTEYVDALLDAGRFDDALSFADEQIRAAAAVGKAGDMHLQLARAQALLALGRNDDAWETVKPLKSGAAGAGGAVEIRLAQARILAVLGRGAEAAACMPDASEATLSPSDYEAWGRAARELVRCGAWPNDMALANTLQTMWLALDEAGAEHDAALLRRIAAELAVMRTAIAEARERVSEIEAIHARLRDPQREQAKLQRTRDAIATVGEPPHANMPST